MNIEDYCELNTAIEIQTFLHIFFLTVFIMALWYVQASLNMHRMNE